MRDHPGIDDGTTSIGDGYAELDNVSHFVRGELRRRSGLSARMASGGRVIRELFDPIDGVKAVHVNTDGTIKSTDVNSRTAATTLKTGYNVDVRPTAIGSNGRVYITNDFDRMQVVDPALSATRNAGMTEPTATIGAPTQANGSNTTVGDHLVRYRFYDSKSLYYSSPSVARSVTVSSTTEQLTFTVGSGQDIDTDEADSHADQIIIQMTTAGGTTYYDVSFTNISGTSSIVVDVSDDTLEASTITGENGGADSAPPPLANIACEHRKRVFLIGREARSLSIGFTNASAAITSSAAFSTEWAGRIVRISGTTTEYRIASVTDASNATLSENWSGTTGTYTASVYANNVDTLYWSEAGLPESWKPAVNARRVFVDVNDEPKAMQSVGNELYVFGSHNITILTYTSDPAGGGLSQLSTDLGCWNAHCVLKVDNVIYGWGPGGCWKIVGSLPRYMSRPIDSDARRSGIDTTYADNFSIGFNPRTRTLHYYYTATGETEPKSGFVFDMEANKWSTESYTAGITAATTMRDENDNLRLCVADENGYSWMMRQDRFDGVEDGFDAVILADTGASGTSIPITTTLQTSPTLAGVYLYQPTSGESRLISTNTSSAITLTSGFTTDPTLGETLYLGRIRVQVKTNNLVQDTLAMKNRPGRVILETVPTSDAGGEATLYLYKDFSSAALAFTSNNDDQYADGITVNADGTCTVSLDGGTSYVDGFTAAPAMADNARSWQLELISDKPSGDFRLADLRIEQEHRSQAKVEYGAT